jgi:serine/threonine protein kinase
MLYIYPQLDEMVQSFEDYDQFRDKVIVRHDPCPILFKLAASLSSLTVGGGTPMFWAPEDRAIARRSVDVFALGIMVMETLKIEKPRPNRQGKECKWLSDQPRLLTTFFGNGTTELALATELEDFIRSMYARNPEERPKMGQVVKTLESIHERL